MDVCVNDPTVAAGHPGFHRIYAPERLTLGFMFPVVQVADVCPDMSGQLALARRIDELGFGALWVRDVPLHDLNFGDVGQVYDPWVWLGQVAAVTTAITLATGAIVLPLRHPLHVAKAAASVDRLSGARFVLGVASGDRPVEFPAFGVSYETRGERFADGWSVLTQALEGSFPHVDSPLSHMLGADLIPKPVGQLLIQVVGSARQSVQWIAAHADGWVTYPRDEAAQQDRIGLWRRALDQKAPGRFKPFSQSLFIDLAEDADTDASPIFLGYRLGRNRLIEKLATLQRLGVHHVLFNLRHSRRPAAEVVEELAAEVLPHFPLATAPHGMWARTWS